MAGRGRGRGRVVELDNVVDNKVYLDLSIDDLIVKKATPGSIARLAKISSGEACSMSLEEIIHNQKRSGTTASGTPSTYSVEVKGTLGARNTQGQVRDYQEDVFKSLDDVVQERGIPKPPHYRKQGNDDLPITGRKVRIQQQKPFSRPTGAKIDPMTNSLDSIIEDNKAGQQGEKRSKRGAVDMDVDLDDNDRGKMRRRNFTPKFVLTPYRAVSFLNEKGMVIDLKIGLKVAETTEDEDPIRKWRCLVQCGNVKGVADSKRKVVAREMACDQFIKNLKIAYPDGKIPHYEVPDELFLDPKVYSELQKLAEESGTVISYDFLIEEDETGGRHREFAYVYSVGDKEFVGRNAFKEYAQIKAAGLAYEFLTGEAFPRSSCFVNEDCDLAVEYEFNESEIYQTVSQVEKGEPDLEFPLGKLHAFTENKEDALVKLARQEISENFLKKKKEEENLRRNMPVALQRSVSVTLKPPTITGAAEESDSSVQSGGAEQPLPSVGRGRGRGRGIIIN